VRSGFEFRVLGVDELGVYKLGVDESDDPEGRALMTLSQWVVCEDLHESTRS
jgi:hypothetical protein